MKISEEKSFINFKKPMIKSFLTLTHSKAQAPKTKSNLSLPWFFSQKSVCIKLSINWENLELRARRSTGWNSIIIHDSDGKKLAQLPKSPSDGKSVFREVWDGIIRVSGLSRKHCEFAISFGIKLWENIQVEVKQTSVQLNN